VLQKRCAPKEIIIQGKRLYEGRGCLLGALGVLDALGGRRVEGPKGLLIDGGHFNIEAHQNAFGHHRTI